jgi:hypothetical protein
MHSSSLLSKKVVAQTGKLSREEGKFLGAPEALRRIIE